MKNIVICFDGTWNTAAAEFPTNVVKTAQLVLPADAQGNAQVVFYDEGVGAMRVAFANSVNRFLGGAFGAGLMDNIERAYRFLAFNYSPGDRIFLFGFSRGAFSARSFGGLLGACGVLRKDQVGKIKDALEVYRGRDSKLGASDPDCVKFRREHSIASISGAAADGIKQHPLTIEYIGVWDTVGSLGVPGHFLFANAFNRKYQFHNLDLSPMVKSARHALSIDERRSTFEPTPWANLSQLNTASGPVASNIPSYQQAWFPGDHASIGGGGNVNGLWQAALVWIVEGAQLRGLAVDEYALADYRDDIDAKASVYCMKKWTFGLSTIALRRWRMGPGGKILAEVSDVGRERIRTPAAELFEKKHYRPRTLRPFIEKLGKELGVSWR